MARRPRVSRKHIHVPNANGTIRWSVLWVVPTKKSYRIKEVEFEHDLTAAISLYTRAKQAGKRLVTLRSMNVGFPPPEKYQPYYKRVRDKRWKKGKRQKGVTKFKQVLVVPLRKLNRRGIFWCPYCREMRKFQEQPGTYVGRTFVEAPGLYCPIDGTSHRDYHVRKWNPVADDAFLTSKYEKRRGK